MGNIISSNNKKIHTVWVGGPIPEIADSYLNIWAELYTDFKTITWIDSKNLYVAIYNKVVKKYREYKLSQFLKENTGINSSEYWEKAVNIEMTLRTDHTLPHERDDQRIVAIRKIIDDLRKEDMGLAIELDIQFKKAMEVNELFLEKISRNEHKNKYGDVNKLLNRYDKKTGYDFSSIYKKEINERGNLAAASDIIRLIALHEVNGLYIDMDLLPQITKTYSETISAFIGRESPAITEKEVYYALELSLGLKGSKTSNINFGLNIEQSDNIKKFTTVNKIYEIFQKEPIKQGLAFKYVGGALSNAEIYSDATSQNYLTEILEGAKNAYDFLRDLPHNFWNLPYEEVNDMAGKLYSKYDDKISDSGLMYIPNYYRDSIVPSINFAATATLNLAGPTMIQGLLNEYKDGGLVNESNLSSISTVEEQVSSWIVKDPEEYVFIIKKLEFFGSKSIKSDEKKTFFENYSKKIRLNINVNKYEDMFAKELIDDEDWIKNVSSIGAKESIKLIKEKFGDLGLSGDITSLAWESPSKDIFSQISDENIVEENTSNYDKNVIVQMQSDQIVNVSVLNLLNKNKETSVILQLSPDNSELEALEWVSDIRDFQSVSLEKWFNTKNGQSLRFQLVGHGNKDDSNETRFGGMVIGQVKEQLNQIISKLNSENSIKNIKLD